METKEQTLETQPLFTTPDIGELVVGRIVRIYPVPYAGTEKPELVHIPPVDLFMLTKEA